MKSKTKKKKPYLLFIGIIILSLILLSGFFLYNLLYKPYKGYEEKAKFIIVQKGMTVDAIISKLFEEKIIPSKSGLKLLLKLKGGEDKFQAGEYLFDHEMSAFDIYNKFIEGDIYYHKFTFIEGQDIFDLTDKLVKRGLVDRQDIEKAVLNTEHISDLAPDATSLEGYLFPETYLVSRTMTADEILKLMIKQFRSNLSPELKLKIKESGFSLHEIVTIASLIEKETSLDSERKLVSSVIHNRLKIKMGLQIDPTIIYALKRDGNYDGNLKRKHKSHTSPYNTYKYRGLPPGPIGNPGLSSLEASLAPADTKFLYYVSKNDGSHQFSRTVAEHNKAVYIWQKKYWRDKWREERRKARQK